MKIAFVGLGRMGAGMTHRLLDAGHEVHAWNRSEGPRATLAEPGRARPRRRSRSSSRTSARAAAPSGSWCRRATSPRRRSTQLAGLLREGDILIDGGNSRFTDGKRRSAALAERGIVFVDAGTSGGVWGYQVGYCLMVGGPDEAIAHLAPVLDGSRAAATAGCTAARRARATSSRWCTTASSTASCRPTPRASRSCTRASTTSTRARSPSSGCRARSCARGCSSCSAWRSTPIPASTRHPRLRRGLRRGPLDGRAGDRHGRARAGDRALADDAPALAPGRLLRGQGQRGAAPAVRRPRGAGAREHEPAARRHAHVARARARGARHLRRVGRPRAPQAPAGALQPGAAQHAAVRVRADRRGAQRLRRRRGLSQGGAQGARGVLAHAADRRRRLRHVRARHLLRQRLVRRPEDLRRAQAPAGAGRPRARLRRATPSSTSRRRRRSSRS